MKRKILIGNEVTSHSSEIYRREEILDINIKHITALTMLSGVCNYGAFFSKAMRDKFLWWLVL